MNVGLLRGFFHRSREWSRAANDMDLLQMASKDLSEFTDADAGCFVYQNRVQSGEIGHRNLRVFFPWGAFASAPEPVQSLVDNIAWSTEDIGLMMRQWSTIEDFPKDLQEQLAGYGLVDLGLWPLTSQDAGNGVIVLGRTAARVPRFTPATRLTLLDACSAQVSLALDLLSVRRTAEEASFHDPLTGLLNRRGLRVKLPELVEEARAAGNHLMFGLIDVDDLKSLNDKKGHPAGDEALRQVAQILQYHVSGHDLVARLGGDEFATVLQVEKPDAHSFMIRIQGAISQYSDGHKVSVGGAILGLDGETLDECYQVADARLYDCKRLAKSI